jgi:hypothetical protein
MSNPTKVTMDYSREGNVSLSSKSGTTFWFTGDPAKSTIRVPLGTTAVITVTNGVAKVRVSG